MFPLTEVAGQERVMWVHVPFSLSDLAQIERSSALFLGDPTNYVKEFKYLTQAYDLPYQDVSVVLTSTTTPVEKGPYLDSSYNLCR